MERQLPFNAEAERSLLGAMLVSPAAVAIATDALKSQDFYVPSHGKVFSAIVDLTRAGMDVSAVTVVDTLSSSNLLDTMGGKTAVSADLLSMISNTVSTRPESVQSYIVVIKRNAASREAFGVLTEASGKLLSNPSHVFDLVGEAQKSLDSIQAGMPASQVIDLDSALEDQFLRLDGLFQLDGNLTGVSSGISKLDEILLGLQPGALMVLGARPAMGKSALGLNIACHVAIREQLPVLYVSLEMGQEELTQRVLASEAHVDSKRLRSGDLWENDWTNILGCLPSVLGSPLVIDDNPLSNVASIRMKARKLRAAGELGLIVIDYLQLMTGRSKESRQVEVAEISRELKMLARELDCPILALSQLSRGLESRPDKRPMLSDLRESGSIEQDADVVLFLYRDEMYNPESDSKGLAELLVAKHRAGETGVIRLGYMNSWVRFLNITGVQNQ